MTEAAQFFLFAALFVCAVVWIVGRRKRAREPVRLGREGEQSAARILERLPGRKYRVLNDILLPGEKGTVQIDHVVVSVYGIFVLETKNYKGWIMGSEYAEQWTQNLGNGEQYFFRNPLKQNYGHCKALERLLGLSREYFIPIVVFTNACEIRIETGEPVVLLSELRREIRSWRRRILRRRELRSLTEQIAAANLDSRRARRAHAEQIRSTVRAERKRIGKGICPRCGGRLVRRRGRGGVYVRCGNYPDCRFVIRR